MARNIEIKAQLDAGAGDHVGRRARELATAGPEEIYQHDVFFNCRCGRLKLRRFADGSGELIAYQRADTDGPEISSYTLVPCADPARLGEALGATLGVLGEVVKQRTVWWIGRSRVHLDTVERLGRFVELEVVLAAGEDEAAGRREAAELMSALAIDSRALISTAYIDLLRASGNMLD